MPNIAQTPYAAPVSGHPPLCLPVCDPHPFGIAGVDALYPIGGYDGAAPEPLINSLNSFSGFPSFA